ncbi:MAG: ATP synthase F1 subunit delta [Clostridiales bacterium]|nr:ATP synthase F1 subunit delta [Clostridiales bacterium]
MAEVGHRYGAAIFDLAKESNEIDQCVHAVNNLLNILDRYPILYELLKNPKISGDEKMASLSRVLKTSETADIATDKTNLSAFINLMITKNREKRIKAALEHFMRLYRAYKGIVLVKAYSAAPLAKRQIDALTTGLGYAWEKEIELQAFVDPSLIGGLLIKTDSLVIDNTIKKHLQAFKRRLA